MKKITTTLGIGVDILKISRFDKMINKPGRGLDSLFVEKLGSRILHPIHELPVFKSLLKTQDSSKVTKYLAGNWAMKEAIYKTLDESDQKFFQFNQWFKLYNERGKPDISNDDYHKPEEFLLSISHDEDVLVATVLRQEVNYYGKEK
ncbi:mitochondrial holo-[acyl-carrier-protein] synthase [[Candida] jaroonii]|uniref:Mitochondrial holo-[acyl-carrier-protein] synthase n=1 Tax=[Candida] jaroonii TaxID=467808 RepID=A0ACA9Y0J9_9ASCO|nr:mitochondrial holo-[acyl-carrier-protein] synthase [[Candida] jaroonii]